MKGFKKISSRIFFGIFTGTLIVFSLSTFVDFFYTKKVLRKVIANYVSSSFSSSYNNLESEIQPLINNAENTAYYLFNLKISGEELLGVQKNTQSRFSNIISSSITQYVKEQDVVRAQYVSEDTIIGFACCEGIFCDLNELKNLAGQSINITLQKDTISFLYYDAGQTENICIRYDIRLQKFLKILNEQSSLWPSRHYLFDENNLPIRSSTTKPIAVLESVQQKEIKLIVGLIDKGVEGLTLPVDLDYDRAVYIAKLKGSDIKIASTIQVNGIIQQFRKYIGFSYIITIFAMVVLAYVLQRIIVNITRPIEELTDISKKIQEGSLNTVVPEYNNDGETAQLSDALRTVQGRMKRYVSDLNSTLKEKRAMDHELKIANKIQTDMIPDADRALTEYPEIDLYAKMIPAKGVAGDFYDYFFLDDQKLFFVIGDVSGKGIPAALFMVKAITLIKSSALKTGDPALVFKEVNQLLCINNDESMFVTAISGVINIQTGELILCDAGHNTPLFGSYNSEFIYKDINKGMPLGIMPDRKYSDTILHLQRNDTLLLYTDGFPECVGAEGNMLSEEKLEESLAGKTSLSLNLIASSLWNLIQDFRQGTPASDDTTLLIIRHFGKNS